MKLFKRKELKKPNIEKNMEKGKEELRRKIEFFELLKKDEPSIAKTLGFLDFLEGDFKVIFNYKDLLKKYGKQPLPFSEETFEQLYSLIKEIGIKGIKKQMEDKSLICNICNKKIEGTFETVGNMFSHTEYDWYIRDRHPIKREDGSYHWECFAETEDGKEFIQSIIGSYEKDKLLVKKDRMFSMWK